MTTAKDLAESLLASYVGGQFKTKSFRDPTRRGEIAEIAVDGRKVHVRLSWSAVKYGKVWYKDSVSEHTLDLARCQYRMDAWPDAGVLRIDCPHLSKAATFYPKGHRKNIDQEDVQLKPKAN